MRPLLTLLALSVPAFHAAAASGALPDAPDAAALFKLHCAQCHGAQGEGGRGPVLAVAALSRARTPEAVMRIIMQGVPATEMPGFFLPLDQIQTLAGFVRELAAAPRPPAAGDASRGEALYRARGNCASCHAIQGEGGVTGPDLTTIGLRRGAEFLKRSVTDPEADIPENFGQYRWHTVIPDNYLQVRIVTRARQEIVGARLNEDPFTIQIRDLSGGIQSLVKADLAELNKDWGRSPMPGYRDVFSAGELDDLVAFLLSLRGAP